MEQPSVTSSATRSVDYLGQAHQWSDSDVLYSYKEINNQLNACVRKCRDEKEKEREQREQLLLSSSSSRTKNSYMRHKRSTTISSPIVHTNNNDKTNSNDDNISINISKRLQRKKELSALKADEKRLVRMKNALWRRMGPTLGVVAKGNKLVSPRTLKWQKECDILWLFGPLYQPDNDPFMDDDDDETLVGSPPATCCPPTPTYDGFSKSINVKSSSSSSSTSASSSGSSSLSSSPTSSTFASPPSSPTTANLSTAYLKPVLKKPAEQDPLKDLISYACELMLLNNKNEKSAIDNKFYEKIFNNRNYGGHGGKAHYYNGNDKLSSYENYQQEQQKPKKKKSIRFSRNLEQVHYTPTHYSVKPPPTRRRMSNPFFMKMEEELYNNNNSNNNNSSNHSNGNQTAPINIVKNNNDNSKVNANGNDYQQIFARAKEQVKSTGKLQLFGEDGSLLEEDDEFIMPVLSSSPTKSQPKKSVSTNSTKSRNNKNAAMQQNNRKFNKNRGVTSNHVVEHSETLDDSGVVKRCVDVASNVKDVVSWCGSMLWNSTVF